MKKLKNFKNKCSRKSAFRKFLASWLGIYMQAACCRMPHGAKHWPRQQGTHTF